MYFFDNVERISYSCATNTNTLFILPIGHCTVEKTGNRSCCCCDSITNKRNDFIVHHSERKSLEPHQWLTGEVRGKDTTK